MSYEPTLIIKKSDLAKYRNKFEGWESLKEGSIKRRVYRFLENEFNYKYPPEIDGIELIVCHPEFTSFNKEVRRILKDWDVQFSTSG